jgi:ariadne-1
VADREEWETRKLRRLGDRQNTPPSQLRFIVDALAQIAECRRVLKWTYGFGYYHFEGGESAKKRFFEFAQADAEETLEHLTEAVETELETFLTETRDAAEFGAFRGKLAGLTDITHKYFDTLVVEIERGFPSVAEETETPGEPAESDRRRDETRERDDRDARARRGDSPHQPRHTRGGHRERRERRLAHALARAGPLIGAARRRRAPVNRASERDKDATFWRRAAKRLDCW